MGSLKYFKVNGKDVEFETHLVNVSKARAEKARKYLKESFGNQVQIRIVKTPKFSTGLGHNVRGVEYDVYTHPDERDFHKLKKRK
jgi:hypothetical protein